MITSQPLQLPEFLLHNKPGPDSERVLQVPVTLWKDS